MKQILIVCCVIIATATSLTQRASASVINSNVDQKTTVQFDDDRWTDEEYHFIMNIVANRTESRNSKQRQKQQPPQTASTKVPQIPPVTADPIQAVQSRVPCNCTLGICACCMGGFFFNNKGCVKLKYIPEDFAFEVRMMFNDRVLYKNIVSGKNPRPICITPPRFEGFVELCARFHNIYFIGRNMHVCLDINASIADFDLIDRQSDCMKLGSDGVAIVPPGTNHPGTQPGVIINAGTDAEIDAGGPDDIESYDEIVG